MGGGARTLSCGATAPSRGGASERWVSERGHTHSARAGEDAPSDVTGLPTAGNVAVARARGELRP